MSRNVIRVGAVTVVYLVAAACGSDDAVFGDDDGGSGASSNTSRASCQGLNWRAESPAAVTCPGVNDCSCGGTSVCCLNYDTQLERVTGAACVAETQCPDYAFACDGPEDCGSGEACCARGRGAHCLAAEECHGVDTFVLCRSDDDCPSFDTCAPAIEGGYYEDLVGFCD